MSKYKGTCYFTGVQIVGSKLIEIGERQFIEEDETGNWIQVDDDETLIKEEDENVKAI